MLAERRDGTIKIGVTIPYISNLIEKVGEKVSSRSEDAERLVCARETEYKVNEKQCCERPEGPEKI